MTWEQQFCPNPLCTDEAWMVQRDPTRCDVWSVAAHVDECPFIVAATVPICPRCGTTLLTLIELEGGHDWPLGVEVGAVSDLMHSLS